MAGGTFTSPNKTRPGAYINVRSEGVTQSGIGTSGIMAMPMQLNWGDPQKIIEITKQTDVYLTTGHPEGDSVALLIKEALKTAEKVLLFNLAGEASEKATAVNGGLRITAAKPGNFGNNIRVVVEVSPDAISTVYTYYNTTLVDKQRAASIGELVGNAYVTFSGEGAIESTAGVTLSGGTTVNASNDSYVNFLKTLELQDFYAFTLLTDALDTKEIALNYLKRWRDGEGKKVVMVAENFAVDYEGVISLINGVVLANGRTLSVIESLPYVTGAVASAGIARSLTYFEYVGAVDVVPRLTHNETETALKGGSLLFTRKTNGVVIEQDINSLVTFTEVKNQDFRKNKIIRSIDTLSDEVAKRFEQAYIGKIPNDKNGHSLLKADILKIMDQFKALGVITEYAPEDVIVEAGADKDAVVATIALSIVDAMEKLYVTVTLS